MGYEKKKKKRFLAQNLQKFGEKKKGWKNLTGLLEAAHEPSQHYLLTGARARNLPDFLFPSQFSPFPLFWIDFSHFYWFALFTRVHLGLVGCGEYYNLSTDRACTWPAVNLPRWSEMIVTISWRDNNIVTQTFLDHFVTLYPVQM